MASYADIASKGPKQSDAEKVPDTVPEILHDDSGVHSLDSLQSPHISSVPSSYSDQQLAEERAEEARREARVAADKTAAKVNEFIDKTEKSLSKTEAQASSKGQDFKDEAGKKFNELKKEASKEGEKIKKSAKDAETWADKNKTNPVLLGNAAVITTLGALLGVGAYRMHAAGKLTWQVAGAWAGAVGLFAVGDYFVAQFLFKKYPPK